MAPHMVAIAEMANECDGGVVRVEMQAIQT